MLAAELLSRSPKVAQRAMTGRWRAVPTRNSTEIAAAGVARPKQNLATMFAIRKTRTRRLLAIPELRDGVEFCLQRDVFRSIAKMETNRAIRRGYESHRWRTVISRFSNILGVCRSFACQNFHLLLLAAGSG